MNDWIISHPFLTAIIFFGGLFLIALLASAERDRNVKADQERWEAEQLRNAQHVGTFDTNCGRCPACRNSSTCVN